MNLNSITELNTRVNGGFYPEGALKMLHLLCCQGLAVVNYSGTVAVPYGHSPEVSGAVSASLRLAPRSYSILNA